MEAPITGGAAPDEDVYSWLLASADQMSYPLLDPNPLEAEALGPTGHPRSVSMSGAALAIHESLNANKSEAGVGGSPQAPPSSSGNRGGKARSNSKATTKSETSGRKSNTNTAKSGKKRAMAGGTKGRNAKKSKQTRADVLERNRRSARECRKRKKERVAELEARLQRLEQENMQLRVQLRVGRETDEKETEEKWRITNLLGDMIKNGEKDESIAETIEMFTERYADYGKERRVACRYHLDYLEKLLVPTQVGEYFPWAPPFTSSSSPISIAVGLVNTHTFYRLL